jgi:hypothetical protein
MGNGISSARYLAVGSFVVNFGTQVYGMLTSPTMKDVADAVRRTFLGCRLQEKLIDYLTKEPFCILP